MGIDHIERDVERPWFRRDAADRTAIDCCAAQRKADVGVGKRKNSPLYASEEHHGGAEIGALRSNPKAPDGRGRNHGYCRGCEAPPAVRIDHVDGYGVDSYGGGVALKCAHVSGSAPGGEARIGVGKRTNSTPYLGSDCQGFAKIKDGWL
jgi:hypothetical protein